MICAILIKLDSEGPVLFHQQRVGRDFRSFQLHKLRTMRNRSAGTVITLGPDVRITRVGRWLRRYKLDELPQLWNVLRGEMSLVGPRPVVPEVVNEFHRSYTTLLRVRPGLTDPASLKYCREAEILAQVPDPLQYFRKVVTPEKIRISSAYMRRATVWSDFVILARTAVALLPQNEGSWLVRGRRGRRFGLTSR